MTEIKVKDKTAFDSVTQLFDIQNDSNGKHKYFDDADKIKVEKDGGKYVIKTNANSFVLEDINDDNDDAQKFQMTSKGGSWFGGIRGEKVDGNTAAWQQLVEKTSSSFHKKYSYLMCKGKLDDSAEKEGKDRAKIKEIMARKLPNIEQFEIKRDKTLSSESVFGVSLRIVFLGAYPPILGKIFFRRNLDGEFLPVEREFAKEINNIIFNTNSNAVMSSDSDLQGNDTFNDENGATKAAILDKLQEVVSSENGFDKYLYIGNEKDKKVIQLIIDNGGVSDPVEIDCESVKALSITYIDWTSRGYNIFAAEEAIISVVFSFGDAITMKCLACESKRLDSSLVELGIEAPQEIFEKHLQKISCKKVGINQCACTQFVCENDIVFVGDSQERLCRNCQHIEKVFDCHGDAYLTKELVYACDVNTLVPVEEVTQCSLCGRAVTVENTNNGVCSLC
ncbi:MAG: hypothetical protein RR416_06325, partial [Clostridia bacterium]